MFSQNLFNQIESYAKELLNSNPLFIGAKTGGVKPDHIQNYLNGINFLVEHTPIHLKIALKQSHAINDEKLIHYFKQKINEEAGHDLWSKSDMDQIKNRYQVASQNILPEMQNLVNLIENNIINNPKTYLGYILLAELTCVVIAEPWLENLETHCGIPKEWMSVIGNHGELDKHHVKDGIRELSEMNFTQEEINATTTFVLQAMKLYWDYCSRCIQNQRQTEASHEL